MRHRFIAVQLFPLSLLCGASSPCDLNGDGQVNVADVQRATNQALGTESCVDADLNGDGQCNVIDVQRFVNAALGQECQATTLPGAGQSFTYYVDATNGSDANPGTQVLPWKTIAKVNSATLEPGQSVGFKRGELWRETLQPAQSGAAGSPITFGAYGSGAKPIINGADLLSSGWSNGGSNRWTRTVTTQPKMIYFNTTRGTLETSAAAVNAGGEWFWVSNTLTVFSTSDPATAFTAPGVESAARTYAIFNDQKNHTTFDNLELTNANQRSIFLRDSTGVTLRHMKIHDSAEQTIMVGVGGGGHTLTNLEVYNSGLNGAFGTGSTIHIQNTTAASLIEHSHFHSFGRGLLGNHAVYDESGGNTWRYNLFRGTAGTSSLGIGFVVRNDNATLAYNVFNGIESGAIYLATGDSSNVSLLNNTIYNCGTESPFAGVWYEGGETGVVIRNNIFQSLGGYFVALLSHDDAAGITSNTNLVYGPTNGIFGVVNDGSRMSRSAWQSATGEDAISLEANPLFTNAAEGDFTLQPGSPAVNAGVDVGLTQDMLGNPIVGTPDIGAYEYQP